MTRLAQAFDALAEAAAGVALELRAQEARTAPEAPVDRSLPTGTIFPEVDDDLPFLDTPQARSKGGGCPVHGLPWSVRPAGQSTKTGQPYNAFWKCDGQNTDGSYCREKPTPAWVKAHPPA